MAKRAKRTLPNDHRKKVNSFPGTIITVVCEGTVTEPRYLQDFAADCGNQGVAVRPIGLGADPKTIVERAFREKRDAARLAKIDPMRKDDRVWCLIDCDDHGDKVHQALEQARVQKIPVSYSNPCFELWALFHLQEYDSQIHRHDLQYRLREELSPYHHSNNPVFNYQKMRQGYTDACRRAERSLRLREDESKPHGNPSTDVHILMEAIRKGLPSIHAAPLTNQEIS
jgi:hypothetical protein